jgi:hypothetical protein
VMEGLAVMASSFGSKGEDTTTEPPRGGRAAVPERERAANQRIGVTVLRP